MKRLLGIAIFCGGIAQAGRYANAFLEIGCGPRALGMGGAVVALIDEPSAFYWNPAGLALISRPMLGGMVGPQFGTVRSPLAIYHQVGGVFQLKGAGVAVNWIRLAVDDIPIYPELAGRSYYDRLIEPQYRPSGEPSGYFSDSENAVFISFAKQNVIHLDLGWMFHRVRIVLPFGVNIKWISQKIWNYEASGLGVDIGAMCRIPLDTLFQIHRLGGLAFGVQVQDLTRTSMSWNTRRSEVVPRNVRYGIAYVQPIMEAFSLTIAMDRETRWGGKSRYGLECWGWKRLAIRVGLDSGWLTAGTGFRMGPIVVDYAFSAAELDALHRIGVTIRFRERRGG